MGRRGTYGGGLLAALDSAGRAGLASLEGGGDRKEGRGSDGGGDGERVLHVGRGGWVLEGEAGGLLERRSGLFELLSIVACSTLLYVEHCRTSLRRSPSVCRRPVCK